MAELDPNIILQARSPQIANPMELASNAMQLRNLGLQGQNQQISLEQNQRNLKDQKTIADLYRANTKDDGTIDHAGIERGLAQAGLGDKIPAYQEQVGKASKETTAAEAAQFDLHKKKLDLIGTTLSSLVAKPDLTHDDAISALSGLVQQGAISAEQGRQAAIALPGRPEQLKPFLVQQGLKTMDASQQITARLATAPKYNAQDTGGVINQGTVDPLAGVRTAGTTNVVKTMTPDQAAKIKLAKEQGFSSDEGNLFGAIAMRGISLPAGLRSKAQMKATAQSLIAQNPGLTVDEIADKLATGQISFAADKKVSTTAAGIEGKISYAENEIKNIMPLVREAAAAVPRSQFVPWNKLSQYADSQISNPELKTLKSYMTTLSNAYDMLAARGGTDMDKRKHNRAMFDTADGPEAMEAAFKAVENEAAISGKAGQASMAPVSRVTQHGPAASSTPPDIAALLKKHGAK